MRVIAGTARRLQLKTVDGMETRPTTDRIKETLFNIINNELCDCMFLDMFSGSGGIGIEALSRGAKRAYFVENAKAACDCINENIKTTKFEARAEVLECDAILAIRKLEARNEEPFDIIFMDPPYNKSIEYDVLKELSETKLVDEYTKIIVEASIETEFDYLNELGYDIDRIKEYKTNKHVFIKKI